MSGFAEEKYAENPRGHLYFMVGSARSGKSTVCKELAKELNATILTQDSFRLAVYDKDWWGPGEPAVFGHIDIAARAMIINGTNVIIDETNTLAWRRDHWKGLGGKAFFVKTPLDICVSRCNSENEGLIGAVKRMHKNIEGFNPRDPKEKVLRVYSWNGHGFDEDLLDTVTPQ
jgi:predicted kinase